MYGADGGIGVILDISLLLRGPNPPPPPPVPGFYPSLKSFFVVSLMELSGGVVFGRPEKLSLDWDNFGSTS